ncbi:Calcium-transporting ATPase 8, plasma membrane-type [Glycine soja]|uniref:Uncharacterized protein n=2 Tax=Glycine subgen. Soja TaxID=1462606 RepID=K7K2W0_SOYBN|nr:Calcium-transporting ATPase 8, plasma membrane-type [Glycine soja]
MATCKHKYFSGHTRNPDGSVQFIVGKTKVGDAIDGVIKIFTVTVTIVVVAVHEGLPLAMAVVEAWIGGGKKIVDPHDVSQFSRMLCYFVYIPEGGNDVKVSESPTEKAILEWGINYSLNFLACKCQLLYWSLQEDNLVLLAIIGLKDPCLPGVKDAIQLCQKAGVEPLFGKREIGGGERMKFICGVWCEKKRMEIFLKMVGLTILFEK